MEEVQLLGLACVLSSDPCRMISQILPLRKLLWRVTAFTGVALSVYLYHMLLQLRFLLEADHFSACCAIDCSGVSVLCALRNMKGAC